MEGRYIAGIVLVGFGVLLALDAADQINVKELVADWWPLILIVVGLLQLLTRSGHPAGAVILLGVGVVFLLINLQAIPGNLVDYLWPVALIVVGLLFLLSRRERPAPAQTSGERASRNAFLGGFDERIASRPFRGGSFSAFLGGGKIDLRDAELPPEGAAIELDAFMGGIELLVPASWAVEVSGTPILGGIENRANRPAPSGAAAATLRVRASVLMGGIEIKN